jgi:hypothetical protein
MRYACSSSGVQRWAHAVRHTTPGAAWLYGVEAEARSLALELPSEALLDDAAHNLPRLAAAIRSDPHFAEHPMLGGRSLESGPFNRTAWPSAQRPSGAVFDLLAARIVDIARLCCGAAWLEHGALPLGPGEAIAYSELARGLLVHWVQLSVPELHAGRAVVEDYRILTPTDFALHPQGALAKCLRTPGLTSSNLQLLVSAFDPCLEVELTTATGTRLSDA